MVAYLTTHNLYLFCQKWSDQILEHLPDGRSYPIFHHKFISNHWWTHFWSLLKWTFPPLVLVHICFRLFLKQNRAHSKWLNHFFNCTYSNTRYLPTLLNTLPTTAFASSSTYGSIMISFFLNSYNCHNLCDLPAFNYPLNGSWKEIKNQ